MRERWPCLFLFATSLWSTIWFRNIYSHRGVKKGLYIKVFHLFIHPLLLLSNRCRSCPIGSDRHRSHQLPSHPCLLISAPEYFGPNIRPLQVGSRIRSTQTDLTHSIVPFHSHSICFWQTTCSRRLITPSTLITTYHLAFVAFHTPSSPCHSHPFLARVPTVSLSWYWRHPLSRMCICIYLFYTTCSNRKKIRISQT